VLSAKVALASSFAPATLAASFEQLLSSLARYDAPRLVRYSFNIVYFVL
jgi:hypothetical protein